jgi:predicted acylesterase/phospholipase RssA
MNHGDVLHEANGVFEGGGAKGLCYVGALEECEKQGVNFRAVAGSSAGAITAMLVACGYTAEEIKAEMPVAFKALGSKSRAAASLRRRSILSNDRLRKWLADRLAHKLPDIAAQRDPTFADLRATGDPCDTLYVVTMDLATGQPFVLSPDLTPDVSVADAVVASSAIPVAFPAQRFEIDREVRRLVDGGVWANYPSFIFLDADFRASHTLHDGAEQRDTIGFVLDNAKQRLVVKQGSKIGVRGRRPWSSDHGSAERELGMFGGLVTSPIVRVAAIFLPIMILLMGATWFDQEVRSQFRVIGHLPDGLEDLSLLVLIALFALLVVQSGLFAYGVIRLGRALTDEGLVGTKTALGVGPSVPYWVGTRSERTGDGPHHVTVRLKVPAELSTLTSNPNDRVQHLAIAAGRTATRNALADFYPTRMVSGASDATDHASAPAVTDHDGPGDAPVPRLQRWAIKSDRVRSDLLDRVLRRLGPRLLGGARRRRNPHPGVGADRAVRDRRGVARLPRVPAWPARQDGPVVAASPRERPPAHRDCALSRRCPLRIHRHRELPGVVDPPADGRTDDQWHGCRRRHSGWRLCRRRLCGRRGDPRRASSVRGGRRGAPVRRPRG